VALSPELRRQTVISLAFIVGIRWSQDDVIGERPHARKMLKFCKKRSSFQKANASEVLYVCRERD
jgi:hypothetical protein